MAMNSSATQKLSELMSNVIVYVEVRTGEDNRSEGIKKVISSLGAKVNNRLIKNTTHVIFKDGLLSTYKKAKLLNIPLVSILWIEACKKNFKLMDPLLFPITNIDRYEFPEMYDKFKRIKSMQPDAIDGKKRLQNIKQTQKNNLKQSQSPVVSKIKAPKIPRTPKDNLNNILNDFQDKIMSTPDNDESFFFKSKLLQKIQNSPFTPSGPSANTKKVTKPSSEIIEKSDSKKSDVSHSVSTSRRESSRNKKPNSRIINDDFSQSATIYNGKNRRKTIASTPKGVNEKGAKCLSSYFTLAEDKIANNPSTSTKIFNTAHKVISSFENTKDQNSNDIMNNKSEKSTVGTLKEHIDSDNLSPVRQQENLILRRTLYTPQSMEISLKFDSARKPSANRRRTVFDISLDLIDKGLKNINEQLKTNKTTNEECAIEDQTDLNRVEDLSTMSCTPVNNSENTPIMKKRKLFMPDQFELTPVAEFNKYLLSSTKRVRDSETPFVLKNTDKKRRTTICELTPNFNKENRRSSFDFSKCQPILEAQTQVTNPKVINVLVCTNMHKDQLEFIERAVKSLGAFEIQSNVSEKTTHVISLECRRTINIIKGIIRGLWILKYEWVVDSFNKGKWLQEETYELREFSRSVEICRSERQAFGSTYRLEIFSDLATIYVSNKCKVPIDSLKDIIKLCSGRLVSDPKQCKYVIGDYYEGKICLQPQWILDCITNNKMMKFFKYSINSEN